MTVRVQQRTVPFDIGGNFTDCGYRVFIRPTVRRSRYAALKRAISAVLDLSEVGILPDEMVYADLYGHSETGMIEGDLGVGPAAASVRTPLTSGQGLKAEIDLTGFAPVPQGQPPATNTTDTGRPQTSDGATET